MLRKFLSVMLVAIGLTVGPTITPAVASGSCYGDYCSGKSPYSTRNANGKLCSDGAFAVASTSPVYGDNRYRLHLMWSPACQSNFALWKGPKKPYRMRVEQSTGYKQKKIWGKGGRWYSPMIYSPTKACRAFGYIESAGATSDSYTAWR